MENNQPINTSQQKRLCFLMLLFIFRSHGEHLNSFTYLYIRVVLIGWTTLLIQTHRRTTSSSLTLKSLSCSIVVVENNKRDCCCLVYIVFFFSFERRQINFTCASHGPPAFFTHCTQRLSFFFCCGHC